MENGMYMQQNKMNINLKNCEISTYKVVEISQYLKKINTVR